MPIDTQFTWANDSHFSVRNLSEAVRLYPNVYSRLNTSGLFADKMLRTTYAEIERKEGAVSLIPSGPRGGEGSKNRNTKSDLRHFLIPHFKLEDQILADDLQNVRRFGSDWDFAHLNEIIGERLEEMAMKHYQTWEYLKWGALNGKVFDADGVTVLLDVHTFMGVSQKSIDLRLGDDAASSPVHKALTELEDYFRKNLQGERMVRPHVIMSRELFDKFVTHPEVEEAYKYFNSSQDPMRNVTSSFVHKGVTFDVEIGEVNFNAEDGTTLTHDFVTPGEGLAVPLGTLQTFRTFYAPSASIGGANQVAETLYSRLLPDPSGRDEFIGLHTQSNLMPMLLRPNLVVRLFSSN